MTVIRISHYQAKPGAEEALHNALLEAIPVIASGQGCRKVRMLPSLDDGAEFIIYEEWETIDAHRAASAAVPATVLSKVMSLVLRPPKSSYYSG